MWCQIFTQEAGCWNCSETPVYVHWHIFVSLVHTVGSTTSDSISKSEKTSLILSTPNSQHATFPSPTAISSTFLLLLRTSSSNLERRTSGCHVFQEHGYLGGLQKHMSSTKTGHHGFSPIHFLCLLSSTSPDHKKLKAAVESQKTRKSVCQVP